MDDEKLSGNTKALSKGIKRAKLFAIQHLTRRIKMLKNKRGTEQQLEKNMRKATRFEEELEFIKELEINIIVKRIENSDLNDSTMIDGEDVEKRAMARLISSKPIQDHLKPSTTKDKIPKKVRQKTKLKLKPADLDLPTTPPASESDCEDDDSAKSDDEIQLERTSTSFFVESLSSVKTRDTTRENRISGKQKNEGTSGRSRNDKKAKKEHKKSSNRMGQRARQRLWKEQYGNKANIIKSNDKMTKRKHDRIMTHKKVKSNENQKPRQESRTKKGIKRSETTSEDTASHPSWEASKRRKMQQNISQTTFQGQKITFDSD